jgi:integration host factor subunit alpha
MMERLTTGEIIVGLRNKRQMSPVCNSPHHRSANGLYRQLATLSRRTENVILACAVENETAISEFYEQSIYDGIATVKAGDSRPTERLDEAATMSQSSNLSDHLVRPATATAGRKPGTAVTRVDLVEAVYRRVGLSRAESARLVELVLQEIADCLERGETVKLSAFGSFVVRSKGPRSGRNPKTGVEVPIASRRVMVFKPSAVLRERLQDCRSDLVPDEG